MCVCAESEQLPQEVWPELQFLIGFLRKYTRQNLPQAAALAARPRHVGLHHAAAIDVRRAHVRTPEAAREWVACERIIRRSKTSVVERRCFPQFSEKYVKTIPLIIDLCIILIAAVES